MIKKLKRLFKQKDIYEFDFILSKIQKTYKFASVDNGGGCSFQKALTMAAFIKEFGIKTSVDIGVYRGRSLFPQAIAHKNYTKGIVYGIDPYNKNAAVQNDKPELKELLDNFVESTNFHQIFIDVSSIINNQGFESYCRIIRKKSHDAKLFFIETNLKLGLVHIDGNHDTSFVMQDVDDYLPLVQDGGFIVMDDVSWVSVKPALSILNVKCKFIGNLTDSQNDFSIFIKNGTSEQFNKAENLFNSIRNHKYPAL